MAFVESLIQFKDVLAPILSTNFQSNLNQTYRNWEIQDRIMSVRIIDCGKQILIHANNTELSPKQRDRLVKSFLQMMLGHIRVHPSYSNIEMIQVDSTHAISQSGTIIEFTDSDKLFTLDQIKQYVCPDLE